MSKQTNWQDDTDWSDATLDFVVEGDDEAREQLIREQCRILYRYLRGQALGDPDFADMAPKPEGTRFSICVGMMPPPDPEALN